MDPDIRLVKVDKSSPTAAGHHDRRPDLSTTIEVVFPSGSATEHGNFEKYFGSYIDHGKSKTVFALTGSGPVAKRFHGAVLKVSRRRDVEPSVFRQITGITPKILYV